MTVSSILALPRLELTSYVLRRKDPHTVCLAFPSVGLSIHLFGFTSDLGRDLKVREPGKVWLGRMHRCLQCWARECCWTSRYVVSVYQLQHQPVRVCSSLSCLRQHSGRYNSWLPALRSSNSFSFVEVDMRRGSTWGLPRLSCSAEYND